MFCPKCTTPDNSVDLIIEPRKPRSTEKIARCPRCKKNFEYKEWGSSDE